MKIGVCGGFERLAEAKTIGFDYVELPTSKIAGFTEEEFAENLAIAKEAGIPTPAFNVLFPGDIDLMGKTPDAEIEAYLNKALSRVQQLGGKVVVFGSGRSRMRPENMPYDQAFCRLVEVTRLIGKVAEKYGITIVIEPLNRSETNMINSVAEGACLRAMVNHPSVKLLADYFHVAKDGEPISDISRVCGVCHVHIATKEGRKYPVQMENGFGELFETLKAMKYEGMVSVEGGTDDFAGDAPAALALLKKLAEA